MRGLRLTVFILVFLFLAAELMRHSYVRWIENHVSVVDKYEVVDKEIKEATSLSALERRYAEELEKQKTTRESQPSGRFNPDSPVFKLRQAIIEWERGENQIRELRYFWLGGFVCLLLAIVCYWLGLSWMSITLQIAGFSEMTWWTTPSFGLTGATQEFTRLLDNKIAFTVLAFALLLIFWFSGMLRPETKSGGEST
jgi:hypothetical protein